VGRVRRGIYAHRRALAAEPDGELLFGLKIENPRADANVESSVRVPGIAFAEWGPGDHGFYLMGRRVRIKVAAKRHRKWRQCVAAC
jgi:hypothetical protein